MRDLLITLIVVGSLPLILTRPYLGIWMWSWLGYMNPHRLTWGFAYNFPFSQVVAIATLGSLMVSREKRAVPITGLTVIWGIFIAWMCLTTLLAWYPDDAQRQLEKILKIQLMCFLTIVAIHTRQQLNVLIWIIVGSLCFFGIKGGIAMLLAGRSIQMYGPGGFIGDNNALAIAVLLAIPLLNYLRTTVSSGYIRLGMAFCFAPIAVAIIGSNSRAAFLGAVAMVGLLWLRSHAKLMTGLFLAMLIPFILIWAPDSWYDRISTITERDEQGEYEGSAQARIETWKMIINLANANPVFGAGLEPWNEETYLKYSETFEPGDLTQAAHSIYFSIMAEHGYVGLLLFLCVYFVAWRTASRTANRARGDPESQWIVTLMGMVQVSLAGYLVAGTFHQLPYFDLPWHLLSVIVIASLCLQKNLATSAEEASGQHEDPPLLTGGGLPTRTGG